VPLADEELHLRLGQAREREHSNLVENMLPVAWDSQCAESVEEFLQVQSRSQAGRSAHAWSTQPCRSRLLRQQVRRLEGG
jgi:hypothetical protein